jgi:hypothetical protein
MTRPLGQTKYSVQNMGNASFDEDYAVNTVEIVGYDPLYIDPVTGSVGGIRRISTDSSGNINTSDNTTLLRTIRNLLESSGNVDVGQRQIVKIGAIGGIAGGTEITTTMPVSGSVTVNPGVVNTFDPRFQFYDLARVKYATGMRANLSFT